MDGHAANPGDLCWGKFSEIGEITVYERTATEQVVERAAEADAVLTNKVVFDAQVMAQLPKLRYIGVLATGYNVVDTTYARQHGIAVTNIPAYSTMSVAQMVMAHLLNITQHVAHHADAVRTGRWQQNADFCFWDKPLLELDGLCMGIVGLGNIGMAVARMAQGMGMNVLAYTSKSEKEIGEMGIRKATSYEELFSRADVLSLHCPLTAETQHLVNAERLALMKPSAILINTGRGPLVDEEALATALTEGRIYAAGLDVLTSEPPREGSPLIRAPRCYITPHIAWATLAARKRLMEIAFENMQAFLRGEVRNRVEK